MAGRGIYSTEELLAWFGGVRPAKRADDVIRGGSARHSVRVHADEIVRPIRRERSPAREEELDEPVQYEPHYNIKPDDEEGFNFEDDITRPRNPNAKPGDSDYDVDQSTSVYSDFSFNHDKNPVLPIHQYKRRILDAISSQQVVVIEGSTGSGKSTQVPQFILDDHVATKKHCNIICTQPRRIAAKSVAKFVASRRNWQLGSLVGYQIGMDKLVSEKTRLTFVTTGVLLEKLVNQRNMNQFTHVILDEVHERDKDTDFLLLIVRKLLRINSPNVKVILMSATFETIYFANYFSVRLSGSLMLPPIIKVEGVVYNVNEFYLNDIKRIGECEPMDSDNPKLNKSCMLMVEKLLKDFDRIEQTDPLYGKGDFTRGTVLIFLPGLPEIMWLKEMLGEDKLLRLKLDKIVLHSSISWEEQAKVFMKPKAGDRKVILATNIAESSITVPDIKYVIDFCLVKQMICDWSTKYCCLQTVWASKASLKQRKGRAGRVSSGRCYRLITRDFYNRNIPEYSVPEMQRCPIESIVLKCKKLNMGEPRATLRLALQPPQLVDIETAIINLKELGALTIMLDGKVDKFDGSLTFVGLILESLPIDVKLGKLLILGHVFGCLDSCLIIAAALSLKSFFVREPLDHLLGYRAKKGWDETSSSDCLAILSAYKVWVKEKESRRFIRNRGTEFKWCKRQQLHMGVLHEVSDLVTELTKRLSHFNIIPTRKNFQARHHEDSVQDVLLLKVVLCGAFYPNYFLWEELDESMCEKLMSGHDPCTTVMVRGLPDNPTSYANQLVDIFSVCGPGKKIHFESQKAFIEFERPTASRSLHMKTSQTVVDSVYLALQLRYKQRRLFLSLHEKSDNDEDDRAQKRTGVPAKLHASSDYMGYSDVSTIPQMKLPVCGTHQITVTSVIDAGHFWAQFSDLKHSKKLQEMLKSISSRPLSPLILEPEKMRGSFCLARFSMDGLFYRAKVMEVNSKNMLAQVLFIDYGNMDWIPFDGLCKMISSERREPALAFECFLSGIKPQLQWSVQACMRMSELTLDKHLMAEVYSQVEGVLRVELYDTNQDEQILINDVLVQERHAIKCPEPYRSMVCRARAMNCLNSEAATSIFRTALDLPDTTRESQLGIHCKSVDWNRFSSHHGSQLPPGPRVPLKGPGSSYEVSFRAMTESGCNRSVRVQTNSINSIVVNTDPLDKHQRMMIAAQVDLNPTGSTCIARDTTLLPAIPGLVHIISLLFAPAVEMRCDELNRQYTGALCGLGFDPITSDSIYPEHDMELTFDTLFTQEDLSHINRIRLAINTAVDSKGVIADWGDVAVKRIQNNIRDLMTGLILKSRISVPPYTCGKYGWNQIPPDDISYVEVEEKEEESSAHLYPLLNGILISGERIDLQAPTKILLMRKAVKELRRRVAGGFVEPGPIDCKLCRITCTSARDMKEHFRSEIHLLKEKDLFIDNLEKDSLTPQK